MKNNEMLKIAIGSDHRGFVQKEYIKNHYSSCQWIDVGTHDTQRTDYPIFANKVVKLLLTKQADYGILLCASGGGMAIAANRYKNIYAVVVWNNEIAQQAKSEDNANIMVIPSDFVSAEDVVAMIEIWLATQFKGGRYAERVKMLNEI
jgi:ribose 5-phosphate isomerase B